MSKQYNRVLTIAGSDSGGGAGIQADIKTISACGCYAASAITAITVQNTVGVKDVCPVPVNYIEAQIEAVLEDIGADAVKTGMLHSAEVVESVAAILKAHDCKNLVVDPVMVSTSGHRLIEEDAIVNLKEHLLTMATIITPNIPEAEILLGGKSLSQQSSLYDAAAELGKLYGTSVLLKAGHLVEDKLIDTSDFLLNEHLVGDKLIDIFYNHQDGTLTELPSLRVDTCNTHGTGCTMSSALASMLAKGMSLTDAAKAAKQYINDAIIAGASYEIGHGHGPVHHFHKFW